MPFRDIDDPFRRLVRIMERLQEPGGCPWDLEQTHESLKPYLIEEAYEALDAIDRGDQEDLKEELGDVLLQVIFHSVLSRRTGGFHVDDVIRSASEKMVRRHPHVFGDTAAGTSDEVLANWEKLKQRERQEKADAGGPSDAASEGQPARRASVLDGVPDSLPALLKAQRMQEKARRVGFDWPDVTGALDKVEEEVRELRREFAEGAPADRVRAELGDLFFALVNLARYVDVDAEEALRQTCRKFRRRFEAIERAAAEAGRDLPSMTLEEMDAVWEQAKREER